MLGQKAKDKITGFEGVVTGHAAYISGCDQFLLVPRVKEDGTGPEGRWFDEQRLVVTDANAMVLDNSKGNGVDAPAPIK